MDTALQIEQYIQAQPEPKRSDLQALHDIIQDMRPGCFLSFLDGKDSNNKTVSNPNIGYGQQTIHYADGKTKAFYQVGISANTSGISVYIMTIADKAYLPEKYAKAIGKASVTGYCIKFRTLKDIHIETLKAAIRDGFKF